MKGGSPVQVLALSKLKSTNNCKGTIFQAIKLSLVFNKQTVRKD